MRDVVLKGLSGFFSFVFFGILCGILSSCDARIVADAESPESKKITVTGVAQVDRVSGANVSFFSVGEKGILTYLGETTTNSNGEYSFAFTGPSVVPVKIVVSGGTYTDPSSGQIVTLSSQDQLSQLLPPISGDVQAPVTPLTTLVSSRVLAQLQTGAVLSDIENLRLAALGAVGEMWGVSSSAIDALPGKMDSPGPSSIQGAQATFVIATFSEFVKNLGLPPFKTVEILNLLAKDFSADGMTDGKNAGQNLTDSVEQSPGQTLGALFVAESWSSQMQIAATSVSRRPAFTGFGTNINFVSSVIGSGASTPVVTIGTQPSNQTASGGIASFSVSASVTQGATLSYQWQKQESGAGSFTNISGAISSTLDLSNLTNANDNGDVYRVVVSATGGATDVHSRSVLLTVLAGPSCNNNLFDSSICNQSGTCLNQGGCECGVYNFIKSGDTCNLPGSSITPIITIDAQPMNQTASGGSASFSVSASVTQGATLSYQWQKQESGTGSFTIVSGATSSTLDLSHLTNADDNGDLYRVVVSATGGATDVNSSSATLTVSNSSGTPTSGTLFAWGANPLGQLGDGTTTDRYTPVQIGSDTWIAISTGYVDTLGIRSDGKLFAWGGNPLGQLGDGTTIDRFSPEQIGNDTWTAVSASDVHTVGIRSDGKLFAWGRNPLGNLGDGTTTDRFSPEQIGNDTWTAVSAGGYHTVGIRSDGKLFAWGYNLYGQLGDGTTTDRNTPVQIGNDTWTAVSAGANHTMAIRSDGKLFGWGYNLYGALGDSTNTNRSTPVQIGNDTWTAVSAEFHTVGIRSDGKLFAWGYNLYGQLGDGTNDNQNSPMQIGSDTWIAIAIGYSHTVAIRSDGKLFAWGANTYGELGDDTKTDRNTPAQIGNDTWTAVSAGENHTVAIRAPSTTNQCASNGWCADESMYYVSGVQCPGVNSSGDGYCAGTGTYYLAGTGTTLDSSGNGTYNGQTYTNGCLKSVITIGMQPTNQTASGGSASFSVSASVTQSATLSYQWQKQESGAGSFSDVSGATSATLNLSNLTNADDDGDVYRVVVRATGGADSVNSNGATLTVNASGGSCQSTDASVASCNGDCYSGAQSLAIGTERQGPGDVLMSLQYNGNHTFKIWKEKCGDRILNASGLVANGWQKKLDRPGTSFGADLTDSNYIQKITGVVCPTNVFVNYDNMATTNRCLYYFVGFDYAWEHGPFALNYYSNGVLGEDYLTQWSMAGTGNGTGPSWYEGNVKPCADAGFRMPTLYETTATGIDSYYHFPPTDATPIFGGNGIPFTTFTWTSSAMDGNPGDYYSWSGTGDTADHIYYSTQEVLLMCVLPSHGVSSPPPDPPDCAGTPGGSAVVDACGVCGGDGSSCMGSNMGGSGSDCSSYINGGTSLKFTFDLAKYNADHGRASCTCGGYQNQGIENTLWYDGNGNASWRVDMTWCSSDGSGGQSIGVIGACTAEGYKYTVSVSSVGGTESSGGCDVSYTTSTPLAPTTPNWPDADGNLYMKVYDAYLRVSAPRPFNSSCPSGYQRYLACDAPSAPGYNPTMMVCGYSTQVNCYSTLDGESIPNTINQIISGQNCVSYCDNI